MIHKTKRRIAWVSLLGALSMGALVASSGSASANDRLERRCDYRGYCQTYLCNWDGYCSPVVERYYAPRPYYQPYYQPSIGFYFGSGGRHHRQSYHRGGHHRSYHHGGHRRGDHRGGGRHR